MAGKIIADTLEHSTAGSLTTDFVVNGSSKAWGNLNGTGTIAIRDSFSVSSADDNGTGNYDFNYSNAMGNANYSAHVTVAETAAYDNYVNRAPVLDGVSTSDVRFGSCDNNGTTSRDVEILNVAVHGDLA